MTIKHVMFILALAPGCTGPGDPSVVPSGDQTDSSAGQTESGLLDVALVGGINAMASLPANPDETTRSDFFGLTDLEIKFDGPTAQATLLLSGIDTLMEAPFVLTGDTGGADELIFDFEYEDDSNFFSAGFDPAGMLTVTLFLLTEDRLTIEGVFSVNGQSLDAPSGENDTATSGSFSYDGPWIRPF